VIAAIVQPMVDSADSGDPASAHPRARGGGPPDAEELARDLERIEKQLSADGRDEAQRAVLRDQLGLLAGRCQWVPDAERRTFLEGRVHALWGSFNGTPATGGPIDHRPSSEPPRSSPS